MTHPPRLPKCWDYRREPLRLARFQDFLIGNWLKESLSKDLGSIERNIWVKMRGCGDQDFITQRKPPGSRLQREYNVNVSYQTERGYSISNSKMKEGIMRHAQLPFPSWPELVFQVDSGMPLAENTGSFRWLRGCLRI